MMPAPSKNGDLVAYRLIRPDELEWITRPHETGEPARHVAEPSERLGFAHARGNVWRYEPGAKRAPAPA